MKIALIADIHSNRQALAACLADARERGAVQYAFLGDFVGYGADPRAVLDTVMGYCAQGAWAVRGNHDEAVLAPPAASGTRADHAGAPWTASQLDAQHLEFLAGLPLVHRHEFMLFVHASADRPQRWEYVVDARTASASLDASEGASHVFGGHVHEQRLFYRGAGRGGMAFEPTPGIAVPVPRHRRWLATAGSVGQPRDGRPEAMYAIFDSAALNITFARVPYDHEAAARAIRAAGLPESNAERLAIGR